jgi:phenylpropionate dioxygenase-like ring-hydroxylating dioxygenase large terminal subunit
VHSTTVGGEELLSAPIDAKAFDDHVVVRRVMRNHEPAPFWKKAMINTFNTEERCDRWQIIRYTPPTTISIDVGVAMTDTGAPDADRSHGVGGYVLNVITPETESSTHYYWSFVRNFDLENRALTGETQHAIHGAFVEDAAILEGQQRALARDPRAMLNDLPLDAGKVYARRLLDRFIGARAV